MIWLLSHCLLLLLPSARCLSFSVFLCVDRQAYWRERGRVGRSKIIRQRESLVLFKSLNTLWKEALVWMGRKMNSHIAGIYFPRTHHIICMSTCTDGYIIYCKSQSWTHIIGSLFRWSLSELFIAALTVGTKHHHFHLRYRIDARITDLKLKKLVEKTAKN